MLDRIVTALVRRNKQFCNSYAEYLVHTGSGACMVIFYVDYYEALQSATAALRTMRYSVRPSTTTFFTGHESEQCCATVLLQTMQCGASQINFIFYYTCWSFKTVKIGTGPRHMSNLVSFWNHRRIYTAHTVTIWLNQNILFLIKPSH